MLGIVPRLHWYVSRARNFPGVHRVLRELGHEGGLTMRAWQELRNRRLGALLRFAGQHVPYYRRVFRECGFDARSADLPNDLARIPLLTKDIIRGHLDELIADGSARSQLFKNTTGGSTGVPLEFYQDQQYLTTAAAIDTQVRQWWGIKPYDRTASVWGADREFHEFSWKERFHQWRYRIRALNAFRMSQESLVQFCRMLERWRPPYLMGYASALAALAHCAKDRGVQNLRFRAIRSAAEMLWPEQRRLIEEVFGSPVYNFYGSREVNNVAAECPEERRLHLISAWRYVEIVDDAGSPVPDGVPGYVAVTDLSNHAMPFVRYRNEDMATLAKEPCPCGRPSRVLENLLGRTSDLIRTRSGEIIHGEFFTHLFYGCEGIRQFQVHQTSLDHLVIRYVAAGSEADSVAARIAEKTRRRLGANVTVRVERCEEMPIPPSGKHRFTISDVDSRCSANGPTEREGAEVRTSIAM